MPDIANSRCMILWGYNPSYTHITHATALVEALKRGMRLIVVDPRRVGLANKADLWLRVRPGTDGALALGIANLMIERGWYDREFIRDWSNGPLLVRADTGRLLTEHDLAAEEDARRFFAWDSAAARLAPYDADTGHYDGNGSSLALEGEYRVMTARERWSVTRSLSSIPDSAGAIRPRQSKRSAGSRTLRSSRRQA